MVATTTTSLAANRTGAVLNPSFRSTETGFPNSAFVARKSNTSSTIYKLY